MPAIKTMHPLERRRKAAGFTLARWAEELGVAASTAHAWERGRSRPAPDKYQRIADLLGVTALEVTELVSPSETVTA